MERLDEISVEDIIFDIATVFTGASNPDRYILTAMFHCIAEQVLEHVSKPIAVTPYGEFILNSEHRLGRLYPCPT